MRRFLVPVLVVCALTLALAGCGRAQGPEWGNLRLTLEKQQQTEKHWTARLVLTNPTDKVQVIEYTGGARYTLIVTRNGETVLEQSFDPLKEDDPTILNLAPGVAKEYVVAWTYRNQEGERVEPGTYEVSVRLNAVTVVKEAGKRQPTLVEPRTVGPVKVQVP
ncbi:MAG: hypothetical protein LOD90_08435 [Symbiobacteriaceae bacterium]|nr:MAG: hypothetical protein DIU55_11865 [Bacillota bacterium]